MNSAAMNTGVQISVSVPDFNAFGYWVELLDNVVILRLSF